MVVPFAHTRNDSTWKGKSCIALLYLQHNHTFVIWLWQIFGKFISFHSENNWNEIFRHTHTDTNAYSHSTHVGIVPSLAEMNAKMEFAVDVCTFSPWHAKLHVMHSVFRSACVPHIAAMNFCMQHIWIRLVFIHVDSWWRWWWWLNVCWASEMHTE